MKLNMQTSESDTWISVLV